MFSLDGELDYKLLRVITDEHIRTAGLSFRVLGVGEER